jgi:murein L,D-transpeptidase YafK
MRLASNSWSFICSIGLIRKFVLLFLTLALLAGVAFLFLHHNPDSLPTGTVIDRIKVEKAARRLSIYRDGRKLKTYRVALGRNPVGPKEIEGDGKTPEGIYNIDFHKPDSDYHLALHISYPSPTDMARAAERGLSAGSDIMIHGLPNGLGSLGALHYRKDWTAGCVALTDKEIEELYGVTPDGTLIEISP